MCLVIRGAPPQIDDPQGQVKISPEPELTPEQRTEVIDMIQRNQDVFCTQPGRTTLVQHHIVTRPGVRVTIRPYRILETKREEIRTEVKKMLELGVIEESHSQWSSPIVLVPKPDGTLRFCNNFRKLNEVSQFDAYPIPCIDELVDPLGKAQYLTTLDLTTGYWQIPLAENAKEKTAFSTPNDLFQYTVLLFGLHGAPATFQRLMDKLLQPHAKYATAYLDDIVIHSPDWETHLGKVEAVLDVLWKASHSANPLKCVIGLAEARYLGSVVGRGLVKPQWNKVEAIKGWPRPVRKKQVRAFPGMRDESPIVSYHFATRAGPLTDLIKARVG
ncbi:unnamed protein product [Lepidochelys kempii]